MPTKRNWAGEQQEYVGPGSSKGGEYAKGSGQGGAKFDGKSEHDFNNPIERESVQNELKPLDDSFIDNFKQTIINKKKENKGEPQYENINLDLSQPIKKIDDAMVSMALAEGYKKEAVQIASNLIKKYEDSVDITAKDLLNATTKQGGLMIGLDFRLKRLGSLSRKLESEVLEAAEKGETITLQDAANKMGDVARFTSVFEPDNFQQSTDKVIRELQSQGYELVKFKNYFQPNSSYKGLNCNFKDKNGNLFELQFHTPASMKIKEGYEIDIPSKKAVINKWAFQSHDIYETTRVLEDKKRKGTITPKENQQLDKLKNYNVKMWDSIKYSFPNWTIDNYKKSTI